MKRLKLIINNSNPQLNKDSHVVIEYEKMKSEQDLLKAKYERCVNMEKRAMATRSSQQQLLAKATARDDRKAAGDGSDNTTGAQAKQGNTTTPSKLRPNNQSTQGTITPSTNTTASVSTARTSDKGSHVKETPGLKIHSREKNSNTRLPFACVLTFASDESEMNAILNKTMAPIDYKNEVVLTTYHPKINEEILKSLNSVIRNTIMLAANELFSADLTTHHTLQVIRLFENPLFFPSNIRLKPSLQRKDLFAADGHDKKYQALVKRFEKLNDDYMKPAKAIMHEDKILVHEQAQQKSRDVLFKNIFRIAQAATTSKIPEKVSAALMSLNHPITSDIDGSNNSEEEQSLIAGFAYLIVICNNMCILKQYTGISNAIKMFDQATAFLLHPKPVDKGFIDYEKHVRIGNRNFVAPSTAIWNQAREIASEMLDITTHITLEQRAKYIQEYTRSLSLIAVRKCAIRQEYITASSSIASLIKHSATGKDLQTMGLLSNWRRKLYSQTLTYLTNEIRRRSGKNTKSLPEPILQRSNDSLVPGSAANPFCPEGASPQGGRKRTAAAIRSTKKNKSESVIRKKKKKKAEALQTKIDTELASLREQIADRMEAREEASRVVTNILKSEQERILPPMPPPQRQRPQRQRTPAGRRTSTNNNNHHNDRRSQPNPANHPK